MALRPPAGAAWLRRFARDRRGASALEFALIAPMMIVVFMGLVETGNVILAGRRCDHAGSTLADLVAQQSVITDAAMNDDFAAATQMMAPQDASRLALKVTVVTQDSRGRPIIAWSEARGVTPDPANAVYSGLPVGLLSQTGDTVVIANSLYTLVQASKAVITRDITYNHLTYAKPRGGGTVTRGGS